MSHATTYVGLDVHKDTIAIASAEGNSQARSEFLGTIPHDLPKLIRRLERRGIPSDFVIAYEAGPTGYGLCRRLQGDGYSCGVIAPSKTPIRPGDRIKTDRRDALKIAQLLRAGELTFIHVPDQETEAVRDLIRTRAAARRACTVAKHQLSRFLLRTDHIYKGKTPWCGMHFDWIRTQKYEHPAQQCALEDDLHEVERLMARVAHLDTRIEELAIETRLAPLVTNLQALRGVAMLTAATIAFEVVDFRRFANARQFMAFLGLVPSEYSSGNQTRRGRITKTGNARIRRVLVEAAWNCRLAPKEGRALQARLDRVSPRIRDISWKAQRRLHQRYRRLIGRGKTRYCTIVAMARELAGFVWSIGQEVEMRPA